MEEMEGTEKKALNVCSSCGYEGPEGPGEGTCPECGGDTAAKEEVEGGEAGGETGETPAGGEESGEKKEQW